MAGCPRSRAFRDLGDYDVEAVIASDGLASTRVPQVSRLSRPGRLRRRTSYCFGWVGEHPIQV